MWRMEMTTNERMVWTERARSKSQDSRFADATDVWTWERTIRIEVRRKRYVDKMGLNYWFPSEGVPPNAFSPLTEGWIYYPCFYTIRVLVLFMNKRTPWSDSDQEWEWECMGCGHIIVPCMWRVIFINHCILVAVAVRWCMAGEITLALASTHLNSIYHWASICYVVMVMVMVMVMITVIITVTAIHNTNTNNSWIRVMG